jgi:hypothetical protein
LNALNGKRFDMNKEYSLMQEESFASFSSLPGKIVYTDERRKASRIDCFLTDISSRNKNVATVANENSFPEKCLLNFKGGLCSNDKVDLEFYLSDESIKNQATFLKDRTSRYTPKSNRTSRSIVICLKTVTKYLGKWMLRKSCASATTQKGTNGLC